MTVGAAVPVAPCLGVGHSSPLLATAPDKAKRRATLAAQLALRGYELHDTREGTYIVSRWGQTRSKCCLDRVEHFARQVGAAQ